MAICRNCGHQLTNGAKFCPECGNSTMNSAERAKNSDLDIIVDKQVRLTGKIKDNTEFSMFVPQTGRTVMLKVPNFAQEGQCIRIRGAGLSGTDGLQGDLLVNLTRVERYDTELTTSVKLNGPGSASTKVPIYVPYTKKTVQVSVPNSITADQTLRLTGLGLPMPEGGNGDLYLSFDHIDYTENSAEPPESQNNDDPGERKQEYAGKIKKCPACGEILNSFELQCSACGYELRDAYASATINAFAKKMEDLQKSGKSADKDKIISLIRTFPIPNTKEDLFEFIILAGSNIREDRYGDIPKYQQEISDAWRAKFEQAYQKACIAFKNDQNLVHITEIYQSKEKKIRSNKITGFLGKEETKLTIFTIVGLLVAGIIVFFILSGDRMTIDTENKRLEAIVAEIYTCIEQEEYTLARAKASSLVFSGSTTTDGEQAAAKWDVTRQKMLDMIDKAEYGADYDPGPREIRIGSSHDDFKDEDYQEVKKQLENRGYTNIKTEPVEDFLAGWWTSEGSVESVSVGGDTVFSEDSTYASDVEIIIFYRARSSHATNQNEKPTNTDSPSEPEINGDPTTAPSTTPLPTETMSTEEPTTLPSDNDTTPTATSPEAMGFEEGAYKNVTIEQFTFAIPNYWEEDGSKKEEKQFFAETGDSIAKLIIRYPEESDDDYDVSYEGLFSDNNNMIDVIERTYSGGSVESYETFETSSGVKGILYRFTFKQSTGLFSSEDATGLYFCFPSPEDRRWFYVILTTTDNVENDYYADDFITMLTTLEQN